MGNASSEEPSAVCPPLRLSVTKAIKPKRVLFCSDLHAGHLVGLTHPDFDCAPIPRSGNNSPLTERARKFQALRRECWTWWADRIKTLRPIDVVVANADLIDGTGSLSGGTELLTTDRERQVEMAVAALRETRAKRYVLTYGTGYHTGDAEDWENLVAERLEAKIGSHEWINVNGAVFDVKHHIGSSSIPHGRHTAIARDRLWNLLWAERGEQPRASVYIRSHVHYFQYAGGSSWLAMTLPALQAAGTKYGARRMSGTVDFGFVVFDVDAEGGYTWRAHLADVRAQAARSLVV